MTSSRETPSSPGLTLFQWRGRAQRIRCSSARAADRAGTGGVGPRRSAQRPSVPADSRPTTLTRSLSPGIRGPARPRGSNRLCAEAGARRQSRPAARRPVEGMDSSAATRLRPVLRGRAAEAMEGGGSGDGFRHACGLHHHVPPCGHPAPGVHVAHGFAVDDLAPVHQPERGSSECRARR